MKHLFYVVCLAVLAYGVMQVTGSGYIHQAEKEKIPLNYFSKK